MKYIFNCIDAHTCGNPVRLVKEGGPLLEGKNMSEKRQHFLREYDWIRTGLMFEPRGHDMMSGSILYPPHDTANDVAVLFIETSGCLPMCGHGTIGTITIVIEEGLIKPKVEGVVRMETPAGLVMIEYKTDNSRQSKDNSKSAKVESVRLTNVASFLHSTDLLSFCSELGELIVDVSYGGNFYAIVDVQKNFKGLEYYPADKLIAWARELRRNINEKYEFVHPEDATIKGCSHILWTGAVLDKTSTARNAVFYGDKAIDRSPCGTGTSARMAQWYTKGKLNKGDDFIHESIIGSKFIGRIEEELSLAGRPAIRPSVEGWAKVYGYNTIWIDKEDDPYAYGFQVL
ncbi:MAG: 4-hydroxyproline epimerase [Chitinophagaceae bacterium]|jgi:4-hydroxyproline epimerase|nr:4-hydroxyproline epimerase [Chitinophagaceae bacterium]MBK9660051.1 4-hydroxyproline epimerase [Chitinophagaceae bacterium]MBK9939246.1 4-hydroxyproline epimerase [Chitinophagaceae bacterium]MBP6232398.1 4-hydroxyproline epimerase [Chitinophagaceae bacterium]MBP6415061.1 4-hydroxyproline epimerase [Chitinophagaceae bacterium]